MNVSFDGGAETAAAPDDDRSWTTVDVKREVTTVKVAIASVAQAKSKSKSNDTCVSLRLDNDEGLVLAPLRGVPPAAAAAVPSAVAAIHGALFEDGRPQLQPLVAFPFTVRAAGARSASKHKDWNSVKKACAADSAGCPQMAAADGGFGWFVEPSYANGVLELVFPGGVHETTEDVWRLKWVDGAWKLTAIDYRTKKAGQEGDAP